MSVDDASALEDTLARLRQRYALYFYVPDGATAAPGSVEVGFSQEARIRFHDADIHYRRVYMAGGKGGGSEQAGPTLVRRANPTYSSQPDPAPTLPETTSTPKGRRVMVNDDSGSPVNTIDTDSGQPAQGQSSSSSSNSSSQRQSGQTKSGQSQSGQTPPPGGWPKATQPAPPQQFR
jgi:hypothetical protein